MENTFMYAVMKTGGKQYKVTPGNTLKIEKIEADVGASVDFDNVLMVAQGEDIRVGTPHVEGGKIVATVLNQGRGKKSQNPQI
jgi:large subunit ribosomal protein L21